MSYNDDTLVVPFSATDVDGDTVTYTATVGTEGADAYALKTQLGLATYLPQFDNFGVAGYKWMRSDIGVYYYFLPNGEIYQYGVGLAGQVATSYYAAPQTLIDQVPLDTPEVQLTIAGGQLTIDPPADYVGTFQIDVSASDGTTEISDTFTVTVTNSAPEWENLPGDQAMSYNDDTLVVPFSATDVDGDTVTYTATVGNGWGRRLCTEDPTRPGDIPSAVG